MACRVGRANHSKIKTPTNFIELKKKRPHLTQLLQLCLPLNKTNLHKNNIPLFIFTVYRMIKEFKWRLENCNFSSVLTNNVDTNCAALRRKTMAKKVEPILSDFNLTLMSVFSHSALFMTQRSF